MVYANRRLGDLFRYPPQMNALEKSIDSLYSAFARVPKPQHIDGCECCADDGDLKRLLSYDVRSIPPDILSPYASSALLTVGSVDDYVFFIPRILHTHLLDESFWPDAAISGRAIESTDLASWPSERLSALKSFLSNVVRSLLAPERHHRIDEWMCAIGNMGLPVEPYLSDIQHSTDAVLQYFNDNAADIPNGKLSNAFWELPNDGHNRIVDWFHSRPVQKIMYDAYGYSLPERNGG